MILFKPCHDILLYVHCTACQWLTAVLCSALPCPTQSPEAIYGALLDTNSYGKNGILSGVYYTGMSMIIKLVFEMMGRLWSSDQGLIILQWPGVG